MSKRLAESKYTGKAKMYKVRPTTIDVSVITWNMQGSGPDATKKAKIRQWMGNPMHKAIVLQECGRLDEWEGEVEKAGWYVHHEEWGEGNTRCSMATLTRSCTTPYRSMVFKEVLRPVIGLKVEGKWIFNIHAPSGGCVAFIVDAALAARNRAFNQPWAMMGDFNVDPAAIRSRLPAGVEVSASGEATQQSGGELDYAIYSGVLCKLRALEWGGQSDHKPIRATFTFPFK